MQEAIRQTRERLQIVLITYNRAKQLSETFDQILCDTSPVRDFDITVFDNDSTDDTRQVVHSAIAAHPNLKYQKNNVNVGGNANICKALESATKDYLWVLCDDDKFDWTGWPDIENAIARNEDLILASNGFLTASPGRIDSPAHQLLQMSFLPSIIYSRRLLTGTALRNAYDNLFALFPHIAPVVMHFNNGGKTYVAPRGVVFAGGNPESDSSYTRGYRKSDVFNRSVSMTMSVGMANLVANLKDRKLAKACYSLLTKSEWIGGPMVFYGSYFYNLRGADNLMNRTDIWMQAPLGMRLGICLVRILQMTLGWAATPAIYGRIRRLVDHLTARK